MSNTDNDQNNHREDPEALQKISKAQADLAKINDRIRELTQLPGYNVTFKLDFDGKSFSIVEIKK